MNVREFKLVNELGQEYSLMDIKEHCLLTEPSGLGYSYSTEYEQLGNTFITNLRRIEQGKIEGQINFLKYDNYKALVDFIEKSNALRLSYTVPFDTPKTYYKDVEIEEISKTEIQPNGIISESITLNALSLWYEEQTTVYDITRQPGELRWNFTWDARFGDYTARYMDFINRGHTEAPVEIEIDGQVANPQLELYVEGELAQTVTFNTTIGVGEKLLYGTKENDFYIYREETDGDLINLFSLDVINFANDNVIRLPKEKSCRLVMSADNAINDARVKIYVFYKAI